MLITGKGTSGSWQVRAVQLGQAIGARVQRMAEPDGLTIMVKRGNLKHVVWDTVDPWPQPVGNEWNRDQVLEWFRKRLKEIEPIAIVAATQHMADDLTFSGVPILWLPHHFRPGTRRTTILEKVKRVGYEGAEHYLGRYQPAIERECRSRGWEFIVNPTGPVDILIALRDCEGYAPKHYKSNVKLANAQGSGTPVICNREMGYLETSGRGEIFIDGPEGLEQAFDQLEPQEERAWRGSDLFNRRIELSTVAATYKEWLCTLSS